MSPIEVIYQQECLNDDKIILRPEGLFLKAYEHSAFLLSVNVKAFKPIKRVFKSLGKEIVSVGFPKSSFEKYMKGFGFVVGTGGEMVCDSPERIDFAAYALWKNSLPLKSDVPRPSSQGERIKVYVDAYALLIDLFSLLVNVPKDCKRTIACEIEKKMIDMVRAIALANVARDPGLRVGYIEDAAACAEDVKLLIRILWTGVFSFVITTKLIFYFTLVFHHQQYSISSQNCHYFGSNHHFSIIPYGRHFWPTVGRI